MEKNFLFLKSLKSWHHSITGKITQFVLAGIVIAFITGACASWSLINTISWQQWVHRANANAQIMTYIVRNIYTNVYIETNEHEQIDRIVSENKIGDEESVIQTGYVPVDVLALVSTQTHNSTWLFVTDARQQFSGISNTQDTPTLQIHFQDSSSPAKVLAKYYVGFATIDGQTVFVSAVPIVSPSGKLLGSFVSSIGNKHELYVAYHAMLKKGAFTLLLILLGTLALVTLFMRRRFRAVPQLVTSLTRIAQEETEFVTPYLEQDDEIGRLAAAIEKLRVAMVERDYLQKFQDMSRKMEHMAHHDALTGLPNRTRFSQVLEDRIEQANAGQMRFNLMLIDLDNFKPVNDTFGHKVGDDVLIEVAARLQKVLGPLDIVSRQGGDEFAVLQYIHHDNDQEGEALATKIIQALSTPFHWGQHAFALSCSIGITASPLQGDNASTLMINADLALYASKDNGRNCFHFYLEGMSMAHTSSIFISQEIISGIENDEFELYYQPIVDIRDDTTCGYEALIRWNHPRKGLIYPDEFIPDAERSGLIVPLGEWILRSACQAASKWPERIKVAVNISAFQLYSNSVVQVIKDALKQSGLPARRLEVEITESEKLNQSMALPVLQTIHRLGVSIAIDNLGTGYAALDYLLIYPFSRIKISRSLIMRLEQDNASKYLIDMLVHFAHKYEMSVTAEGVETVKQRDILREIACQNVQGYYYSRPVPEKDVLLSFAHEIEMEVCHDQ